MRGNDQVIAQLNMALKEELTAINQYFLHAEMAHNWGYHRIGDYIKKQSIDEMKHAEKLIERLLFLDATPKMDYMDLTIGANIRAQLESDLKLEEKAVVMYNNAIKISREAGRRRVAASCSRSSSRTRKSTSTGSRPSSIRSRRWATSATCRYRWTVRRTDRGTIRGARHKAQDPRRTAQLSDALAGCAFEPCALIHLLH